MKEIKKCCGSLVCLMLAIAVAGVIFLWWAYQVIEEGALYLPNAPGTVAIVREKETGIAHIRGDSYKSVAYGQGFAHAQTRLW